MALITGVTKVVGIFGDPVEHSLSPLMHNSVIEIIGIDYVYVPWKVEPPMLESALSGVRAMGIRGVNLTIPHKERALNYLDSVSKEVEVTGAVNTVVNDEGRLSGYNTDGRGFILSLLAEHAFSPRGKRVVVIGAGGAARGIAAALALDGAGTIIIANRTEERAKRLASEFGEKIPETGFFGTSLDRKGLEAVLGNADLLVNASSAGMNGMNDLDVPLEALPAGAIVADIVYKPLRTKLLRDAERLGLKTENGLGMLACQGALALELWAGCPPPLAEMKSALRGLME